MGGWFSKPKEPKSTQEPTKSKAQQQISEADIVKSKIKISRDRVNNIVKAKNNDISKIDEKIKDQLAIYQETGSKKKLLPLLRVKKDLENFIETAEVRIKLLNEKLSEVEIQQINVDTINALDDSNKYIKQIQDHMEKNDWQGVIDDAKNKYELEWPQSEQQLEDDPSFQAMWDELGGNKLVPNKKQIEKKKIKVQIPEQKLVDQQQQQRVLA